MPATRLLLLSFLILATLFVAGCQPVANQQALAPDPTSQPASQTEEPAGNAGTVTSADFDCAHVTDIPASECQALVTFYESTEGADWRRDGTPLEEGDSFWLESATPCSWVGVTCAGGHVDMLALFSNGLQGQLPADLSGFVALRVLDLHDNAISGPIPAELGQLPALESLDLSGNRLVGPLPAFLGALGQLDTLVLAGNALDGSIPPELGQLVSLRNLDLSANQLSGAIPETLANMTSLESLRLDGNKLEGTIPVGLGTLPALAEVNLAFNQLTGAVPPGWPADTRHMLWGNRLEGTLDMRSGEPVVFGDVQVTGDPALALNVWPEEIAAVQPAEGAPWWDTLPAHIRLTLVSAEGPRKHAPMGIHVPGEAQIHVYPVAGLDEIAREQVGALQALLDAGAGVPDGPLPLLPPTNAQQLFQAQRAVLNFQNGRGIRYLTQVVQGPTPVANDQIFYTFQGLTDDGSAYVAAFFPVRAEFLPATAREAAARPEMASFLSGEDTSYVPATVYALNEQPGAAFAPGLERIDALIASLSAHLPDPPAPNGAVEGRWPDEGEAVDGEPVLQWEAYPGAAQYELVVVDDDAYPPFVAFSYAGTETVVPVTPALAPGSYSWTVRAQDTAGQTLAELNRQFWVKTLLAALYPPAGEAVDAEPMLQWQPVAGASNYQIVVLDDGAYPPAVVFEALTAETNVQVSPALPEGRHYTWTVWAQDENGRTVAELGSDFNVYARLERVQPADLAQVGSSPTLQWRPFPGAASYEVTVVTGYPPQVVFAATTSEAEVTVSPALAGTDTHYWTVWARDGAGQVIAALAASFTVAR